MRDAPPFLLHPCPPALYLTLVLVRMVLCAGLGPADARAAGGGSQRVLHHPGRGREGGYLRRGRGGDRGERPGHHQGEIAAERISRPVVSRVWWLRKGKVVVACPGCFAVLSAVVFYSLVVRGVARASWLFGDAMVGQVDWVFRRVGNTRCFTSEDVARSANRTSFRSIVGALGFDLILYGP